MTEVGSRAIFAVAIICLIALVLILKKRFGWSWWSAYMGSMATVVVMVAIVQWVLTGNAFEIPQAQTTNTTATVAPISTDTSFQKAPSGTKAAPSTGVLPTLVGQCDGTTVSQIGTRLVDGTTGQDIAGSGSAITYADGGYQVSYDTITGLQDWSIGDQINLCLVSMPTGCPPGDWRGKVYDATNLRTGEVWEAQNSGHSCGGA